MPRTGRGWGTRIFVARNLPNNEDHLRQNREKPGELPRTLPENLSFIAKIDYGLKPAVGFVLPSPFLGQKEKEKRKEGQGDPDFNLPRALLFKEFRPGHFFHRPICIADFFFPAHEEEKIGFPSRVRRPLSPRAFRAARGGWGRGVGRRGWEKGAKRDERGGGSLAPEVPKSTTRGVDRRHYPQVALSRHIFPDEANIYRRTELNFHLMRNSWRGATLYSPRLSR